MKAVRWHTQEKWIHLYVQRWLEAPTDTDGGITQSRSRGTPQGGVISPLLANIFMHHAFDDWMRRKFPTIQFERYADDGIVHCSSLAQARMILGAIQNRMEKCGLELHPDKTRIIYCKDVDRTEKFENVKFDFLGFSFRPRLSKDKNGRLFVNFSPAISGKAAKNIRKEMRGWKLHKQSDKSLYDLANIANAKVQGWINYYGKFYKSAMCPTLNELERHLIRWVMRKYKRFANHQYRAATWLGRIARRQPLLFAHWRFGVRSMTG